MYSASNGYSDRIHRILIQAFSDLLVSSNASKKSEDERQTGAVYQLTILSLYRYSSIDIRYDISHLQHAIPHFDTLQ